MYIEKKNHSFYTEYAINIASCLSYPFIVLVESVTVEKSYKEVSI